MDIVTFAAFAPCVLISNKQYLHRPLAYFTSRVSRDAKERGGETDETMIENYLFDITSREHVREEDTLRDSADIFALR